MFAITQSHRTEYLLDLLLDDYRSSSDDVFARFVVIVPSMVLGEWLDKTFAERAGISTLVTAQFWGQYQWQLMQNVLDVHNAWLAEQGKPTGLNVPEVAVLSQAVMQWRVFGYLRAVLYGTFDDHSNSASSELDTKQISFDHTHPLYETLHILLEPMLKSELETAEKTVTDNSINHQTANQQAIDYQSTTNTTTDTTTESRLWQLAGDIARMFTRYLTYREDWLIKWSRDEAINVAELIKDKDELSKRFDGVEHQTPAWLTEHYTALEVAKRHLWQSLFAEVFEHR